jgi:phosphosulfolactate synthase (CoM biosynthesis protein A)
LIWTSAALIRTDQIKQKVEQEEQEEVYTFSCGATVGVVQPMPGVLEWAQLNTTNAGQLLMNNLVKNCKT